MTRFYEKKKHNHVVKGKSTVRCTGGRFSPGEWERVRLKMKKGLVLMQLLGAVCNLRGGGRVVGMGLTHDEKERHGGIKTGGIHICKTGEMMVFESEKMIWYEISRKSNENVTQKYTPK